MKEIEELSAIVILSQLTEPMLKKIEKITRVSTVKAGDFIFEEGEYAKHFYAIIEGKIVLQIEKNSNTQIQLTTLYRGNSFGISSLVDTDKRTFMTSAKAIVDTSVFKWAAADLEELFYQDYEMGFMFMKRVAKIIKTRLEASRAQILDIYS